MSLCLLVCISITIYAEGSNFARKELIVMILNDTVRQALTAGHFAHMVTLDEDGSPHVSLVWIGLDDDEIVCAHEHLYRKLKNIQRDRRVALSIVTEGKTDGLENYLVINGRASVTRGGAPDLLNRLARIYLGPETVFPSLRERHRSTDILPPYYCRTYSWQRTLE